MPSSDLILNVKQIAGYPSGGTATASDAILIQRGGIGGPYLSLDPVDFVVSAIGEASEVAINGGLTAFSVSGGSLGFSNGVISLFSSANATIGQLNVSAAWLNGEALATQGYVRNTTVSSFNLRRGDVIFDIGDLLNAGGAPIFSPVFQGTPSAPTPDLADNSARLATTAYVQQNIGAYINYFLQNQPLVFSFNGRSGDVTLQASDLTTAGLAPLDSPAFTGIPTAPTAPSNTDTTQIATTAFVTNAVASFDLSNYAPLNSPNFSGSPTAPTPPPAASDGRIATTAFVHAAVVAATTGVSSFNTRTGAVVLTTGDITSAGGAVLASPQFTGVPTAPTAALATNTNQIATCAFVLAELGGGGTVTSFNTRNGAVTLLAADITAAGGALLASPALTGAPTAPTATAGTSTTQIATTAFVANAIAGVGGVVNSFNGRSGAVTLQANDISAAGGAVLASPSFSGTPTAPTATAGTSTQQIATTAFVTNAIAGGLGVSSFMGRTGAVTLTSGDITTAGGAVLASPAFTGAPTAPTAAVATNNTQVATTAFVQAALGAGAVTSFNTRTGAVTLAATDITAAGGAVLASPAFSGVPTAPTASQTTNTNQVATTAFVQSVVNAIGAGVVSFNGRTGVVTLQANDVSAAGGALIASPTFTGTPAAPTPATADSSTTIATTAFVKAAAAAGYLPLTGGTLSGQINAPTMGVNFIAGSGASPSLQLDKSSGAGQIIGRTNTSLRWLMQVGNQTAESGGNAGSDFELDCYGDGGGYISNPIMITRSTGYVHLGNQTATFDNFGNATLTGSSGNIQINGNGFKPSGGPWAATSDARIKTVQGDYELGLDQVIRLRPIRYVYKGNDAREEGGSSPHANAADKPFVGLIAQEVEAIFPAMVSKSEAWIDGEKVNDLRQLDTGELTYALINAVKTLAQRVHALESATR